MTEQEKITAQEAVFILESSVFHGAFESLDARYVNQWRSGTEIMAREEAWLKQRVLADVRNSLLSIVRNAASKEKTIDGIFHKALKQIGDK